MAVLVFSGGHFVRVPTQAENAIFSLAKDGIGRGRQRGFGGFTPLLSGNATTVYVNPAQVAYIVEDEDFERSAYASGLSGS